MTTYRVTFHLVSDVACTVEADNEEQAEIRAAELRAANPAICEILQEDVDFLEVQVVPVEGG